MYLNFFVNLEQQGKLWKSTTVPATVIAAKWIKIHSIHFIGEGEPNDTA